MNNFMPASLEQLFFISDLLFVHLNASSGAFMLHEMTDWGDYLPISQESAMLVAEIKGHILQGLQQNDAACRVHKTLM